MKIPIGKQFEKGHNGYWLGKQRPTKICIILGCNNRVYAKKRLTGSGQNKKARRNLRIFKICRRHCKEFQWKNPPTHKIDREKYLSQYPPNDFGWERALRSFVDFKEIQEKKCGRCQKIKPRNEFHIQNSNRWGLSGYCKDCIKERSLGLKLKVMNYYSGNPPKCSCCGETNIWFLTIDHINNDGAKHRKEIGNGLYNWLIRNNYPNGFQVMCWNCNCAKGKLGYCPHKQPI